MGLQGKDFVCCMLVLFLVEEVIYQIDNNHLIALNYALNDFQAALQQTPYQLYQSQLDTINTRIGKSHVRV